MPGRSDARGIDCKDKNKEQSMHIYDLKIRPLKNKREARGRTETSAWLDGNSNFQRCAIVPEELFAKVLSLERKRTERSRKPFLLMLLDAGKLLQADGREKVLRKMVSVLSSSTRETDVSGWYRENFVLGVIYTEIVAAAKSQILDVIRSKVSKALRSNLDLEQIDKIHISFHIYPEDRDEENGLPPVDSKLYPDLFQQGDGRRFSRFVKRTMDIVGSLLALVLFSPLFAVISLLIKLSSKGPILFKQERVGQYGTTFTFLKFRSMHFINDANIHKEYVNQFISGKADAKQPEGSPNGVYKLVEDARITRVGKFLRMTSMDELPQFLNVLKGEMSLVGPRPPIPYELASYDNWHRRRVLQAKPGITGLWQVNGRSKTTFDEMVRLDLRYARSWSLWLDIKILLQTPRAVLSAEGAY